ncbi:hypothetical protein [Lacticaseibacillus paracasei]|uniref:Phage tail protein n=1 Tax=Lacticaseibacillus paracasei NRIC 0644 TaxID=1435038 RepID=A0A0C9QCT8_LACPA|nr:hypothetical protein [Lacticaseibacillus paracasei]GAN36478.1 hypothetical protein LC0644_1067 [Lacticaseibacillus paracasei NRIC 0644]
MKPGQFFFAGRDSLDLGLMIQHRPLRQAASRNFSTVSASNRSGLTYRYRDTFANTKLSLDLVFLQPPSKSQVDDVADLFDVKGYVDFTPYWDEHFTYKVAVELAPEFTNTREMVRAVTSKLDLSVYPYKYIDFGLVSSSFGKSATLTNPFRYPALPVITLQGSGDMTLTINSQVFSFVGVKPGGILIDSDEISTNQPAAMVGLDYPVLQPGINTISTTGTGMAIKPNYVRKVT